MKSYAPRIAALARQADRDREQLRDSPVDPTVSDGQSPDPERAYLREGAGRAIWLYVEGRTGGRFARFSPAEYEALETAMNDWLECYAWSHGVELDAAFTLREAAELLLETRNIHDVGQLLTGVPGRN